MQVDIYQNNANKKSFLIVGANSDLGLTIPKHINCVDFSSYKKGFNLSETAIGVNFKDAVEAIKNDGYYLNQVETIF